MKNLFISVLIFVIIGFIVVQNSLTFKIKKLIKNKDCIVGVSVISGNRMWNVGNQKQPLLSVFKILVALKVLENENINLNTKLKIDKSMLNKNTYSPMLKKFGSFPFEISIKELLEYMISQSDNNACDILLDYYGGIAELEKYIHSIGFTDIEIFVNEKEMNIDIEKQYLNKAYNKDIVRLIKKAHEGKILSEDRTEFFNEIMIKTSTGENKLKAGLPQDAVIGHKTGSSSRNKNGEKIADNDAGFIILKNGKSYYISVMLTDSKMPDDMNAKLIKDISSIVYNYIN